MLTNASELEQAERDRALLAAIVESSDDAIVSKTLDGVITSWNAAAERLLGYSASEAIGRDIRMLIPPERQHEEDLILEQVRRGERVDHFETVRVTKVGRRIDASITVSPVRDRNGNIIGASKILRDITATRRAEKALQEGDSLFSTMADAAPVLIWAAGTDSQFTYVNSVWLEYTGRTPEQEYGTGWTDIIHPDDVERCLDVYVAAFKAHEHFEVEYRLRRHDGAFRWILARGAPRFAPDGTFAGYVGSCTDIHDWKRSETRSQFLARAGTLLTEGLDFRATLTRVAHLAVPDFADWCSVKLSDDESLQDLAVAHADPEKVRFAEDLQRRFPPDPDAPVGVPYVLRTGQSQLIPDIPDEMLVQSARSQEELDVLRQIGFRSAMVVPLVAGRDITGAMTFVTAESGRPFDEEDLRVAEEIGRRAGSAIENARLHGALIESEARFRRLADALPQIVYTLPGEGNTEQRNAEYLNAQWYAYTGLPEDVTYADAAAGVVHPDDMPVVSEAWREAAALIRPMEAEIRLRRHDGVYHWFLTRIVPVLNADGSVSQWFGTSTDIHNQKAAEAELADRVAARTAELARSNEALDQFAYVASHDLKSPLRAIDNLATWIAQDAGHLLPEESQRHLSLLQGRILRMEHLLSDLLAYSRTTRDEGHAEEVDTARLVQDVVDLIAPPPDVEIVAEDLPTIVTPRAPLEMVFRNLIDNAVKHRDGSGVRVRITADPSNSDGFVSFTVSDDGPGIPARHHERIFGLFQTLRPRDQVEGSGMGLAVVKKAVESLGGAIRVESSEGEGAAFTFTWPIRG